MENLTPSLVFTVRKKEPVTVVPATPAPTELKFLSDIDDQQSLRMHFSGFHIYRASAAMNGLNPVPVLLDALAKALVFYYPLAGRLREHPALKLAIDCTGEGVVFVEADADITLDEFSHDFQPPFPCIDQLIHGIGADPLTSPLVFMQLTRLRCGGFILGHHVNHAISDAAGLMQFMNAVAEIACGASSPSVAPVWARELLMARDPPKVTCDHHEYDAQLDEETTLAQFVLKPFFFGLTELAALRQQLPPDMKSTRFELLTACLWRCRVAALQIPAGQEVRVRIVVNARRMLNLPKGYYGNAQVYPLRVTTAGELIQHGLAYAVELVRAAKNSVTEEYLHSVADLMVVRGRPRYTVVSDRTYGVSDLTRVGFNGVNFGWGEAMYSGPAVGYEGNMADPRRSCYFIGHTNIKGEEGTLVPVALPAPVMERFQAEVDKILAVDRHN